MYEVFLSHEAEKFYKKQDKGIKRRLNKCIDNLSREPLSGPNIKNCMAYSKGITDIRLAIPGLFTKSTSKIRMLI